VQHRLEIALCLAVATFCLQRHAVAADPKPVNATVLRVVSGAVVEVAVTPKDGEEPQPLVVRLAEADAPQGTQSMATESMEFTQSLLAEDSEVKLILAKLPDTKAPKSSESPVPATLLLKDGTDVGAELIRDGLAWWDWRDANLTADERSETLAEMEAEAKLAGSGVFSHSNPVVPANYLLGARVGVCRSLSSVIIEGEPTVTLKSTDCVIVALVPNPRGADGDRETVVLGNRTQTKLSVSGWKLMDDDGGSFELSGTIEPGSAITFTLDENLTLGNSGDIVWLQTPTNRIAHAAEYFSARSGQFVAVP